MSMPPNSGKYAYCAASHADGRSIPAHRQRRQPETRRLPAIGWSACGGKPETVRSKGFSNGVYLFNVYLQNHVPVDDGPSPMTTWARGVVPSRLYPLDSGKGIRFDRVFEGLKSVNYDGWITLHHAFDGNVSPNIAAKRSAEFLRSFDIS